jgi:hypothetical protein
VDALGSPLDLAAAGLRLDALARRQRELLVLAAALCVAAPVAAATGIGLDWPLLAGAVSAAVGVLWMRAGRRAMLTRLVAQGDALSLPAVRVYAERLLDRRAAIAGGLRHVVRSCSGVSGEMTFVQPDRVDVQWQRLERLAAAFADPDVAIQPASAALCVRMLREPVTSPLYNLRLPEEQLDRLLTAIERGVEL